MILGEPASKANRREIVTIGGKWQMVGGKRVRVGGRPSSIKSDKARDYERDALMQIPAHAKVMFSVPVRVTMRIFYATERPDLDESVVLDVLQAKFEGTGKERRCVRRGVYLNDRLVREKHVFHGIDRANPRAEIVVEPLVAQGSLL